MLNGLKNFFIAENVTDIAFIVTGSLVVLAFIVLLVLSYAKPFFGVKERLVYLPFLGGISSLQFSLFVLSKKGLSFCLFCLGVGLIFFFLLACVRERKEERYSVTDRKEPNVINVDGELPVQTCRVEQKKDANDNARCIDYSHIKNILERLEFVNVSEADKRQIRQLEANIVQAEGGESSKELEDNINDGLSSLLKIMSKYGV